MAHFSFHWLLSAVLPVLFVPFRCALSEHKYTHIILVLDLVLPDAARGRPQNPKPTSVLQGHYRCDAPIRTQKCRLEEAGRAEDKLSVEMLQGNIMANLPCRITIHLSILIRYDGFFDSLRIG